MPVTRGFKYTLLLVDVATRYCWMYGLPSLTSSNIIDAFASFTIDAGGAPKTFHADFDHVFLHDNHFPDKSDYM